MSAAGNDKRREELAALVREIQERVRQSFPTDGASGVRLADLMPAVHARDAAEGKAAAIGSVNPRPPGLMNDAAQAVKRLVARSLNWLVRDQIEFNRLLLCSIDTLIEALNEANQTAAQLAGRIASAESRTAQTEPIEARWSAFEEEWRTKLMANETALLRQSGELAAMFQHRTLLLESNLRTALNEQKEETAKAIGEYALARERELRLEATFQSIVKAQHEAYQATIDRSAREIQQRLWDDLSRVREEFERRIHEEVRPLRQRAILPLPSPAAGSLSVDAPIDWTLFADRFRGPEPKIRDHFRRYVETFRGAPATVLDLGCGRGEFLELMREAGISAIGIDQSPESLSSCAAKGLTVVDADIFRYLEAEPDSSVGGIFCAQVIEHLPPLLVPHLVRLCHQKLRPGAPIVFETPNPESLAIFATHFYIDPTHQRPVPPVLMSFYLEDAGFMAIEITRLFPAVDSMPEAATLPEPFRERFFGALDYAIAARRRS